MPPTYQEKKQGIRRILSAFNNTYQGLSWMIKNEAAFKQELVIIATLIPISFLLNTSTLEQLALINSLLFVLFAEAVNTAIESVVDRISYEHHDLSGLAKDLGSAAVLISFAIAIVTWGVILWKQ